MDLVDYYERELQRLAEELHGGLTQSAAGARLWLNCWNHRADPQALQQAVAAVAEALDKTLADARALAATLRPLADHQARFLDCVADLMANLQNRRPEPVNWSCDGVEPEWSFTQRAAVGRLLRHALRLIEQDTWIDLQLAVMMTTTSVTLALATRHATPASTAWPRQFGEEAAPLITWLSARWEVSSTESENVPEVNTGLILSVASHPTPS